MKREKQKTGTEEKRSQEMYSPRHPDLYDKENARRHLQRVHASPVKQLRD